MQEYLEQLLQERRRNNLYRTRHVHSNAQSPLIQIDGREYLAFCSNDYLGLANHPVLKTVLQESSAQYGIGSGASHLIIGHTQAHQQLEQALAELTGRQRALLFSTGYMANLGVITALMTRQDALFFDKLNHASLIDAALLSRAKLYRYPHNDIERLEHLLSHSTARHKLIVTEGVFSMDGDIADLPTLVKLAKHYSAWVMVDDAHGLGVLGKQGRGTLEYHTLSAEDVPILMGTLGKAFGVFGAFVAGSESLIEVLIQAARPYIYTTALPPALAAVTCASLNLAQQESWRRQRLHHLIRYFRTTAQHYHLPLLNSQTAIQPLVLGDAQIALAISHRLYQHHILVPAIRPPTVPPNTSRLRITLSATHQEEHIDTLLEKLSQFLMF